jgi:vancomycin resistance protein YoaR
MKSNNKSKAKVKKLSSKQKTNKILAILTLIALAITVIIIGQFIILDHNTNHIMPNGTIINGYNVSGMSKAEAGVILSKKFNEKADKFNLTITTDDKSWSFGKQDFVVNSDIHTILEASELRENYFDDKEERVTLISQFEKAGGAVNVAFNYMFVGLDEKIEEIIKEVEVEPIDSTITFNPDSNKLFNITDSVSGIRVDREALYRDINDQFLASNNVSVELKFIEEVATITKEYNENLTQKIATFSTNVADSTGGRKHNVKLALEKFNGFIIEPNQQVSFNEVTGEHSIENGYKSATIIYNGEFTDGIGGGVCQASTTLYNALLLSGVEINEVHKHTLPEFYVPFALDAMVSEYTSDLRFTNTTEYPMYIHTFSDANSVTVEVYSCPSEYTYKTRSETIDTISAGGDKIITDTEGKYSSKVLFEGEYFRLSYPKDGYEAKSYLQKYIGDKLIEEKEIRHEIYQPQKGVVVEGAEKLPDGMTPIDTGVEIYTD